MEKLSVLCLEYNPFFARHYVFSEVNRWSVNTISIITMRPLSYECTACVDPCKSA